MFAPFGGHTDSLGYFTWEIGNVSVVVDMGDSFQSEKDLWMRMKAVANPPMTTAIQNTPGTADGPGGRDRMLAVKSRKNGRKFSERW